MWPFKDKSKEESKRIVEFLEKRFGSMSPCNQTDCFFYGTVKITDIQKSLMRCTALFCLSCADFKRDKDNYIINSEVTGHA